MNPVGWFEIYVDDLPRATTFYQSVFQKTLIPLNPPGGEVSMMSFPMEKDASGCTGALVKMNGVKPGNNSTIVYFVSDDCANEAARVQPAGGKIMKPKFSIGPYGFITLAHDTEGNLFGVHSMK